MVDDISTEQILSEMSKEGSGNENTSASPASEDGAPVPAATSNAQLYTYKTEGGKEISENLEMVLKRAGLGYHYAQRAHLLNQQADKYKQLDERVKALSRWEEYDNYAKTNPNWAKHVEETWNNRQNLSQSNQEVNPEINTLRTELAELKKFRDEITLERTSERDKAEDSQFAEEIGSVEKTYGVDLSQADENGQSLEWRILSHMKGLGLSGNKRGQFTAAFKDYYHDELVKLQNEKARDKQLKDQAALKKEGILGVSRTPKANDSSKGYRPGMSWNELSDLALSELASPKT